MKKVILKVAAFAFAVAFMSSCAVANLPVSAFIYADAKGPVAVTGNAGSTKVGTSEATGILGWVTTGDASIEAAAKNAGITRIHHVDYHTKNILGIYATHSTIVYGE